MGGVEEAWGGREKGGRLLLRPLVLVPKASKTRGTGALRALVPLFLLSLRRWAAEKPPPPNATCFHEARGQGLGAHGGKGVAHGVPSCRFLLRRRAAEKPPPPGATCFHEAFGDKGWGRNGKVRRVRRAASGCHVLPGRLLGARGEDGTQDFSLCTGRRQR